MAKTIRKLLWQHCFNYMQRKHLRRIFARRRIVTSRTVLITP